MIFDCLISINDKMVRGEKRFLRLEKRKLINTGAAFFGGLGGGFLAIFFKGKVGGG